MEWCNTWTLIILALLLVVFYWYASTPKNLPPGPAGLPLLGYAASVGGNFEKLVHDMGEKYGDIYHMYLGSQLVVIFNDFEVIKEAFVKQGNIFAGRPKLKIDLGFFNDYFGGLALAEGEFWKQHRRFMMHTFKEYGIGTSTLEPLILNEVYHFVEEIQAHRGKPFNILELLMISTSNNVKIFITGKRSDYSDPVTQNLIKAFNDSEEMANPIKYFMAFPWLEKCFRLVFRNCFKKGVNNRKNFVKFVSTAMTEIKKEFVIGQTDNYFQSYLTEKEKQLNRKDKENIFTDAALINNTRDLLFAGTDTTANTILWLMTYMTAFPEVQRKAQREIDLTIGRDRDPTYNDRVNTPYVEATIFETHRFASVVGCSVPRRTVQSTTLRGYNIPADTIIYPHLRAVHHDPKLWGDPENFRPERFLNADGACVRPDYLIPFSIGKRVCPGEALVKMEIYFYFVCLQQRFNFVPSNGVMPSLEPITRITSGPKSELICAEPRKH